MLGEKLWVRGIIRSELGASGAKILFAEHHQSHAAAAFLTAPTQAAAILTADGVGEWATLTTGTGKREPGGGTSILLDREIRFPHSLGMLYSTFTAFLGFEVNEGEYKVMGLAAYGRPTMADQVRTLVSRTADGAFRLDLDYFGVDCHIDRNRDVLLFEANACMKVLKNYRPLPNRFEAPIARIRTALESRLAAPDTWRRARRPA